MLLFHEINNLSKIYFLTTGLKLGKGILRLVLFNSQNASSKTYYICVFSVGNRVTSL